MEKSIRQKTGDLLMEFGLTPNMKGFRYIVEAVELASVTETLDDVFKEIAENHNANPFAVERATSNALKRIDYENEKVKAFFGDVKRTPAVLIGVIVWKMENE